MHLSVSLSIVHPIARALEVHDDRNSTLRVGNAHSLFVFTMGRCSRRKGDGEQRAAENQQVEIYRTFLASYTAESDATVTNLANQTSPLDFWPSGGIPQCLHGIDFTGLKNARTTVHVIDSRLLLPDKVILVNAKTQAEVAKENDPLRSQDKSIDQAVHDAFASGVLTLSEISFDKTHSYAVMSYSFYCGMLCGNGRTIVFKKIKGKWRETQRQCGGWVS